jgi:hypothetical protein
MKSEKETAGSICYFYLYMFDGFIPIVDGESQLLCFHGLSQFLRLKSLVQTPFLDR